MNLQNLLICAVAVMASRTAAQQPTPASPVSGIVYTDVNGNGARDAGEKGVRGVSVSNQVDVSVTDSLGRFELPSAPTGVIFVSVPDGYKSIGKFWKPAAASGQTLDFAIQRERQPKSFSFVHASDPHIEPKNVDRFRHFRSLVDSSRASFVLMGGDLIRDAMSQQEPQAEAYFDLFVAEERQFKIPVWTVPGNHDNFGIIRTRSHVDAANPLYGRTMYHHYFGPDYYSFTYGGIHFIGLNTVAFDDSAYYGFVDSVELGWLKRDLAQVPAAMPVVTFDHIPLASAWTTLSGVLDEPLVGDVARGSGRPTYRHTVGNAIDVIGALRERNFVLGLSSHMHVGERIEFQMTGKQIRFETSPAIVGGNQLGPIEFPSGFTVYRVRDGQIDRGVFVPLDPPARPTPSR